MSEHSIPRHRRIHRMELDEYDDVISVKDRLQFVTAGRVLLLLPADKEILQRKLDLVLIQRAVARQDMRLALVTTDFTVIDHARELNISTFRTAAAARRHQWKTPRNKVFVDRNDRPQAEHEQYDLMRRASRLRAAAGQQNNPLARMMRGGVFGVAMLVLLFGFYATFPSATVTLTPARDGLDITVPMFADPNLERAIPESRRIPATVERRLQESTVTVQSTGRRPAENSLAEGIVTFTNQTASAQLIPAGTIVQTSGVPPVRFETQENAALPARVGSAANIAIRALPDNPDFSGNQPPGVIDTVFGTLGESITVTNRNATYGEGVREITVVTQTDHQRLQDKARDQVLSDARYTLLVSLPESEFLIVNESLQIVEERAFIYSADVEQPAESVSLTLQAVIEVTIVDLTDAEVVALGVVNSQYISNSDLTLDLTSLQVRSATVQNVMEDGSIAFQMRVEGNTYVNIDADQVSDRLSGLSVNEARAVLDAEYLLDARYPPEISTWPAFLNRMPVMAIRINVDVQTNE